MVDVAELANAPEQDQVAGLDESPEQPGARKSAWDESSLLAGSSPAISPHPSHPSRQDLSAAFLVASLAGYEYLYISQAQSILLQAITRSNLTRTQIAHRLGWEPSHVSKIVKDGKNVTVKTMARVLWACGMRMRIEIDVEPS